MLRKSSEKSTLSIVDRISILGVPIDCGSQRETILRLAQYCRMPGQFHVVTPNPEMLVEAQKNPAFKDVLNRTALNLPDGIGLVWAIKRSLKRTRTPTPTRITGTDTLIELCSPHTRICPPERVFLLGAAPGIAEKAAEELKKRNHMMKEIGTYAGSPQPEDEEAIIRRINAFSPTLLFVAYGAPSQDLWIDRNLPKMPSVKIAMGIGGAFDFLAGRQKRAPLWMRRIGLEWLWRLLREPRRLGRIWNAVAVFPWMVLKNVRTSPEKSKEDDYEVNDFIAGIHTGECRLKPAAIAQTIHLTLTPHHRYPFFQQEHPASAMLSILDQVARKHGILIQEACVMPDHVHILLCFARGRDIGRDVIRKIKGGSSFQYMKTLQDKPDKLWGKKYSFQSIDTDEQFQNTLNYIRQNPAKANISPDGRILSQ